MSALPGHAAPSVIPGSHLAKVFMERIENPRFEDGRMCDTRSTTFAFSADSEGRSKFMLKTPPTLACGMFVVSGNKPLAGDQWAYNLETGAIDVLEFTGIRSGDAVVVHYGFKRGL
jgi:hypothetical protein